MTEGLEVFLFRKCCFWHFRAQFVMLFSNARRVRLDHRVGIHGCSWTGTQEDKSTSQLATRCRVALPESVSDRRHVPSWMWITRFLSECHAAVERIYAHSSVLLTWVENPRCLCHGGRLQALFQSSRAEYRLRHTTTATCRGYFVIEILWGQKSYNDVDWIFCVKYDGCLEFGRVAFSIQSWWCVLLWGMRWRREEVGIWIRNPMASMVWLERDNEERRNLESQNNLLWNDINLEESSVNIPTYWVNPKYIRVWTNRFRFQDGWDQRQKIAAE